MHKLSRVLVPSCQVNSCKVEQAERSSNSPVHTILLGPSADKAQHFPVMLCRGPIVGQTDQIVIALLLCPLQLVLQAVEAGAGAHAATAACLTLPLLHPAPLMNMAFLLKLQKSSLSYTHLMLP